MQVAIGIGGPASGRHSDWVRVVDYVREAERLGVSSVWSAEAWGQDAITVLAYLAGKTSTIGLGTGIMQISARAPSMTAMTALSLASISGNRFRLGLGASGPQVVEGLHGVPFRRPLTRLREHVEVVRLAFAGEKLAYAGRHHELPLPGGEGKALRLSQPGNANVPIYLATLSPKGLELTGELADGWLGTSFTPEGAEAFFPHLQAGAEKAGRDFADLDLAVGGVLAFGDPDEFIPALKPRMAFTLGAMGSPKTNFYNDAFRRGGWEDAAREVQGLWIERRRDEAAARVPDEMILRTNFLGDEASIGDRLRRYRDCGITTLRVDPQGGDAKERLDTLGRAIELVREVSDEEPG